MKLEQAIETVLELARNSILWTFDPNVMTDKQRAHEDACNTVEDFFVNNVFD